MNNENKLATFLKELETKNSFVMDGMMFVAVPVLKGKMVYSAHLHDNACPGADVHFILTAVCDKAGAVHLVEPCRLGLHPYDADPLPSGVKLFSNSGASRSASLMARDMAESLPTYGIPLSGQDMQEAEDLSWLIALDADAGTERDFRVDMGNDDYIGILLGKLSLEDYARERFNGNKDGLARQKAVREKAAALAAGHAGCKGVEIYRSLAGVDAKFLSVTFEREGQRATGRLSPDAICRNIRNRSWFSSFEFQTNRSGEELYRNIFHTSCHSSSSRLTADDIAEIRHGRNAIYSGAGNGSGIQGWPS